MSDDEIEVALCDHCGVEAPMDEIDDCQPDDTGHCVRCGLSIGGRS